MQTQCRHMIVHAMATYFVLGSVACRTPKATPISHFRDGELQSLEEGDRLFVKQLGPSSQKQEAATAVALKFSPKEVMTRDMTLSVDSGPHSASGAPTITDLEFSAVTSMTVYAASEDSADPITPDSLGLKNLTVVCRFDTNLQTQGHIAAELELFGMPAEGAYGLGKRSTITQQIKLDRQPAGSTNVSLADTCRERFLGELAESTAKIMESFSANLKYPVARLPCDVPLPPLKDSGDAACSDWFNQFDANLRKFSVARCIPNDGLAEGSGFCAIQGKYGSRCPIFLDQRLKFVERADDNVIAIASNPGIKQLYCDGARQHVCRPRKGSNRKEFLVSGFCDTP